MFIPCMFIHPGYVHMRARFTFYSQKESVPISESERTVYMKDAEALCSAFTHISVAAILRMVTFQPDSILIQNSISLWAWIRLLRMIRVHVDVATERLPQTCQDLDQLNNFMVNFVFNKTCETCDLLQMM